MGTVIGNMQMGEKQALALAGRAIREELVQLIQEAKELDMQAAQCMRQSVTSLSSKRN
jgi:signal transduction histidine kinase